MWCSTCNGTMSSYTVHMACNFLVMLFWDDCWHKANSHFLHYIQDIIQVYKYTCVHYSYPVMVLWVYCTPCLFSACQEAVEVYSEKMKLLAERRPEPKKESKAYVKIKVRVNQVKQAWSTLPKYPIVYRGPIMSRAATHYTYVLIIWTTDSLSLSSCLSPSLHPSTFLFSPTNT